jgi:hypothetical protein
MKSTSGWAQSDNSGQDHTPLAVVWLSTPEWQTVMDAYQQGCGTNYSPEMIMTVWDTDPTQLQGRGEPFPLDAHVANRYFSEDAAGDSYDIMGCGASGIYQPAQAVYGQQTPLLHQMITTAVAS